MWRNSWPAPISRASSTVRDANRLHFRSPLFDPGLAATGCAQRTPVSKVAPARSARLARSTTGGSHLHPLRSVARRRNPCPSVCSRVRARHVADPSAIATPAPRFSSTGFYPLRSRPPATTNAGPSREQIGYLCSCQLRARGFFESTELWGHDDGLLPELTLGALRSHWALDPLITKLRRFGDVSGVGPPRPRSLYATLGGRFRQVGSFSFLVGLGRHVGAQCDRQPPGSVGKAANGGGGQAGLRPRVPSEPGGTPCQQSLAQLPPADLLSARSWGEERGTICSCCRLATKSFNFDLARCCSSPAGAGRAGGTCSLA